MVIGIDPEGHTYMLCVGIDCI